MPQQNILFASLRSQCPSPTIAVVGGGSLAAGSFYLGCVGVNRVGLNRASALQAVTWTTGQKIRVTLPATMRVGAEEPHRILIAASATNNPSLLQPLCWWRGFNLQVVSTGFYQEVANTLPYTVELATPDQMQVGGVAANPNALTAIANPLDGMIRWVTSLAANFYYDPLSTASVDGVTCLSAGTSPGRWLPWIFPETFGVGTISDVSGPRGCSRDVRSLEDADVLFPPPRYAMDGTQGPWCTYWIANGLEESGTAIDAGQRVGLEISQNGQPKSELFDRRVMAAFPGVVRVSDGSLSPVQDSSAREYVYGQPIYTLEQNLNSGYALAVKVAPRFYRQEIDGYLQASPLSVKPALVPEAGAFVTGYRLWGDVIYPLSDRRRIFPRPGLSVQVGGGSGLIKRREFELRAAQVLNLPTPNVSDQKITINSNGDVFYRGSEANYSTEVTRAVITLGSGRSNPSAPTAYTAVAANGALEVIITYPQVIRANYPDPAIAGAGSGQGAQLNAPFVCLYVQRQSDGQIREYTNLSVLPGATQQFLITAFNGTVISSLPNTVGDFGFWASAATPQLAVQAVGGLAADSYRVYWGFRYDGYTVSAISHSTAAGCIAESDRPISELFAQVSAMSAVIQGIQNGTLSVDVLNALIRGSLNVQADQLLLNADAAGTAADWSYLISRPPTGMSANQTLTLPPSPGQSQQALIGDGAGALQYASVIRNQAVTLNFNSANIVNWFTLPANAELRLIEVKILTAFNGSTPLVSVGIASNNIKHIQSSWLDLKSAAGGLFQFPNRNTAPTVDEPLILTYTASTATVGSALFIAHFFR